MKTPEQHIRFALFLLTQDCKSEYDVPYLLSVNDEQQAPEIWKCIQAVRKEFKRGRGGSENWIVAYPKEWPPF